ncbi:transcription factor UPBEAT1-like [Cornus florida]|uniref:transcription factor UPBEAT1-like n=1 Tax=Cornus florida TaxID=4283 RepID=UPI0028A018FE|nr:transcription factor UPBEAT1-like [Cornus florida]
MGASPQSFNALNLKGMFLGNKGTCQYSSDDGSLWSKVLRANRGGGGGHGRRSRQRRMLMKRRAFPKGCGRPTNGIVRRVRILKKLVPNGRSKGLDGLFTETADYILCLQMKVKVMQMMVNLLSKTDG